MTRKRFIKLLMAMGYNRNGAQAVAWAQSRMAGAMRIHTGRSALPPSLLIPLALRWWRA